MGWSLARDFTGYARVQRRYWIVSFAFLIGFAYLQFEANPLARHPYALSQSLGSTSAAEHGVPDPARKTSGGADMECASLPGANDTVIIMKTGATELEDKFPIHLTTTLRCYPHQLVVSDHGEVYEGFVIHDVLEDVDEHIKATHPDFHLWRRLRDQGRAGLNASELSGPGVALPDGNGKPANPGWKLDKWKFLPMMRKTLEAFPDKKWYVFVETDTYIFWSTWLAYSAVLDWQKPYYIGAEMQIGEVLFAHGGSGYAVSRPALEQVVQDYTSHKQDWEKFTDGHWAGDCVLGKAFAESGTQLTWAWPIWQGDPIHNMKYDRVENDRQLWCDPSVSYHRMTPSAIEDLWNYEQSWVDRRENISLPYHRHSDIYANYVLPKSSDPRESWDNNATDDKGPAKTPAACRAICEADESCVQYVLNDEGKCLTTWRPSFGEAATGR
ncbi:hypothetical protein B0A48_11395 [Cryoendolithus antarcticus]|uniref:Apple domain-containing protein n=1 Tax=Cryoendolithus antarcticus TaxID=1507870 RepID=A0A1V8SVR5_9PEZI|nr:hypothetical protein B0A48_11395 [Cryoendolithus antarcticus]